ncbi:sensor histidine kinase [Qipengyuania thermophila]|uniref:sensor histidine kinase n=1 Tax=Qipengyuania thermophila TaxID=2509361 RepID=UPI001F34AF24|nr:histidine kinase dimerization/phosphoacceptor domain -containing protein [Qipengyuania thermophila]
MSVLFTRFPLAKGRPWIGHAVAVVATLAACALRFALDSSLPTGFPFLTFLPVVILVAFLFGVGPGVVSAVLSTLLAWYFFVPPPNSWVLSDTSVVALLFLVFILAVQVVLIHWMQRANAALDAERRRSDELVSHRETLFKELQHRVGNNLQMIGSLIALQKRRMDDPAARAALDEASRRLGLVGRIQRQLYDPAGAQLSLAAYIDQICRDVIAASGRDGISYEFVANADASLPPEKAIPTALVIAEALNNSLEHGFGNGGNGKVVASVARADNKVEIIVADNGAGLPAGFDIMQAESLGLRIARTLAQSLGGCFTLEAAPAGSGTVARLVITNELASPPLPA